MQSSSKVSTTTRNLCTDFLNTGSYIVGLPAFLGAISHIALTALGMKILNTTSYSICFATTMQIGRLGTNPYILAALGFAIILKVISTLLEWKNSPSSTSTLSASVKNKKGLVDLSATTAPRPQTKEKTPREEHEEVFDFLKKNIGDRSHSFVRLFAKIFKQSPGELIDEDFERLEDMFEPCKKILESTFQLAKESRSKLQSTENEMTQSQSSFIQSSGLKTSRVVLEDLTQSHVLSQHYSDTASPDSPPQTTTAPEPVSSPSQKTLNSQQPPLTINDLTSSKSSPPNASFKSKHEQQKLELQLSLSKPSILQTKDQDYGLCLRLKHTEGVETYRLKVESLKGILATVEMEVIQSSAINPSDYTRSTTVSPDGGIS